MSLAVIIPNYNKQDYLRVCIESVLNQSLVPDEIWIIDDCSTDNSQVIIQQLAKRDSRIHPVLLNKNGGVSAARNTGIKMATTEYITTLDSDDYYFHKDKLINEMNALKKAEIEGKDNCFAYSRTVYVDHSGENPRPSECSGNVRFLQGKIFVPLLGGIGALFTVPRDYCIKKKHLVDAGLFDETSNYFEDLDLLIRVSQKCEALFLNSEGVAYRQGTGGLAAQSIERYRNRICELRKKYTSILSKKEYINYLYYRGLALRKRCVSRIASATRK